MRGRGARRGCRSAGRSRSSGGPGSGDGLVLVGTSDGEVVALDEETGEQRWVKRVSSEVLSPPIADRGVVVVRTQDGKLFGLDRRDGTRVWVYDRAVPALSLRGTSTPVVADDAVVAGKTPKLETRRVDDSKKKKKR